VPSCVSEEELLWSHSIYTILKSTEALGRWYNDYEYEQSVMIIMTRIHDYNICLPLKIAVHLQCHPRHGVLMHHGKYNVGFGLAAFHHHRVLPQMMPCAYIYVPKQAV
jgi:hypothetical protein